MNDTKSKLGGYITTAIFLGILAAPFFILLKEEYEKIFVIIIYIVVLLFIYGKARD